MPKKRKRPQPLTAALLQTWYDKLALSGFVDIEAPTELPEDPHQPVAAIDTRLKVSERLYFTMPHATHITTPEHAQDTLDHYHDGQIFLNDKGHELDPLDRTIYQLHLDRMSYEDIRSKLHIHKSRVGNTIKRLSRLVVQYRTQIEQDKYE